jgi:membrane associated rhomboid family serine protease
MTFIKTIWTKIKSRFISQQKSCINSDLSQSCNVNKYTSVDIVGQDFIISDKSGSSEPYFPIFTVCIGLIDIFMLIVVYIVQEGTVLTSDTWIKMGCKYVPCMKPLYSKGDQEIYNAGLKSQCQSFPFPYQFFRFITPIFLHGDITHLLSNLVYQALAGSILETKYGRHVLGISYILFGFSGNIMSALCNPTSSKLIRLIYFLLNIFF